MTVRTVLTVAALTLHEASRRRVLRALAALTILLLALSAFGFSRIDAEFGGAHQRRGAAGGLHGAQPRDVRPEPDRRARHGVPGRARRWPARSSRGWRCRCWRGRSAARRCWSASGWASWPSAAASSSWPGSPSSSSSGSTVGYWPPDPVGRSRAARGADDRAAHPRPAAVHRHLADGVGHRRRRPVRCHLDRGRGRRASARRSATTAWPGSATCPGCCCRPTACGAARCTPSRTRACWPVQRGVRGPPVPEPVAAHRRLPRVGRAVGRPRARARGHGVPAPRPVSAAQLATRRLTRSNTAEGRSGSSSVSERAPRPTR